MPDQVSPTKQQSRRRFAYLKKDYCIPLNTTFRSHCNFLGVFEKIFGSNCKLGEVKRF
jgi:hypothetical protein